MPGFCGICPMNDLRATYIRNFRGGEGNERPLSSSKENPCAVSSRTPSPPDLHPNRSTAPLDSKNPHSPGRKALRPYPLQLARRLEPPPFGCPLRPISREYPLYPGKSGVLSGRFNAPRSSTGSGRNPLFEEKRSQMIQFGGGFLAPFIGISAF